MPGLLLLDNKDFGVSANLRHACAIVPNKIDFFNYDWRKAGMWNLVFALGIALGGTLGGVLLANPEPLQVATATQAELEDTGVAVDGNLAPTSVFGLANLQLPSLVAVIGFFIGGLIITYGLFPLIF